METIKKYKWIVGIGIVILIMLTIYIQYNKIERLKKKAVLSDIDKQQSMLMQEVIPNKINEVAPLPEDKAKFGSQLPWGE